MKKTTTQRTIERFGVHKFRWNGEPKEEGKSKHHKKCVTCGKSKFHSVHDLNATPVVEEGTLTVDCPHCRGEGKIAVQTEALIAFLAQEGHRGA